MQYTQVFVEDLVQGLDSGRITWKDVPETLKRVYYMWEKLYRGAAFRDMDDEEDYEYNLMMALSYWDQIYLTQNGRFAVRPVAVTATEAQAATFMKMSLQEGDPDGAIKIASAAEKIVARDLGKKVKWGEVCDFLEKNGH